MLTHLLGFSIPSVWIGWIKTRTLHQQKHSGFNQQGVFFGGFGATKHQAQTRPLVGWSPRDGPPKRSDRSPSRIVHLLALDHTPRPGGLTAWGKLCQVVEGFYFHSNMEEVLCDF